MSETKTNTAEEAAVNAVEITQNTVVLDEEMAVSALRLLCEQRLNNAPAKKIEDVYKSYCAKISLDEMKKQIKETLQNTNAETLKNIADKLQGSKAGRPKKTK